MIKEKVEFDAVDAVGCFIRANSVVETKEPKACYHGFKREYKTRDIYSTIFFP